MFQLTCPETGTCLRGVEAIIDNANTPMGVMTAVRCRCGGHAILRHGDQIAHAFPTAAVAA